MRLHDRSTRRLAVLGALSALTVGALAFPALAGSVTDDPSEEVTEETTQQPPRAGGDQSDNFPDVPRQVQGMREGFVAALAEELDLPVDTVTDAIEAASERLANQWEEERLAHLRERLGDAVADGDLTQEQADAIIAAAEAGVLPFGPGLRHGPGMGLRNAPEIPRMHGPPLWDDFHDDAPDTGTEGS
jgi:hypothetical protein